MQAQPNRSVVPGQQHPLTISLVVLVIWIAMTLGGAWLQTGSQGTLNDLVTRRVGPQFVLVTLFLLAVVFYLGWQRAVGLKSADPPSSWRLLWFPLLLILVFLATSVALGLPPAQTMVFVLINTLLVGVSEELMFRGIIFRGALSRFNIWPAILLTTVLFGFVHVVNGFLTGNFGPALTQALSAALSGIWLHAIRLRTRSLYPAMLIHGLWDFSLFLITAGPLVSGDASRGSLSGVRAVVGSVAFVTPLLLYGLWLLRGIGKHEKAEFLT